MRRHAQLGLGVGATVGGVVLLSTNLLYLATIGASSLPWIPLSANVALIAGGAMFLREYRRAKAERASTTG